MSNFNDITYVCIKKIYLLNKEINEGDHLKEDDKFDVMSNGVVMNTVNFKDFKSYLFKSIEITDYFIALAEWRDRQIDEILKEDI